MYLVIELQKDGDTLANVSFAFSDLNQAKAKYHQLLSVAAVSSVERHAVAILDDTGRAVFYEWYDHEIMTIQE